MKAIGAMFLKMVVLTMAAVFVVALFISWLNPANAAERDDHCSDAAQLARLIMQGRQYGLPVERAYEIQRSDLGRLLVREAYELPRYKSNGFRDDAIERFTTERFLRCLNFAGGKL